MKFEETLADLEQGMGELGVAPLPSGRVRRSGRGGTIALTESDGILRWDLGEKKKVMRGRASEIRKYRFEDLGPNRVSEKLRDLDEWLTPGQGIRQIKDGEVGDPASPESKGRILLLIHGTFSNCEGLTKNFNDTPAGTQFLQSAEARYDQVLAFNHPTLSVSPFLNALDLNRAFSGSEAEVDIICHSRGGLVARWWLETLRPADAPACRVVFVGSPLGGTGLASPGNIRGALDLLANLSSRLAGAAAVGGTVLPIAAPIFHATTVIAGIVSSVSAAGASMPAIDAAIALIPGLAAQSRQGANEEILALRRGFASFDSLRQQLSAQVERYHFVLSNFESEDPGWAFWRAFRKIPGRVADAVTNAVFDGPNDLVVDTASMTDLADEFGELDSKRQIKDFDTTDTIHHCNYFQQQETIAFIRQCLRSVDES